MKVERNGAVFTAFERLNDLGATPTELETSPEKNAAAI